MRDLIRFLTPQLPAADSIEHYFARSRELRRFSNDGPCLRHFAHRAGGVLGRGLQVVPTANCTLALMLGLRALAGSPRAGHDEVVLPSFTFPATAGAVVWSGFTPVFADINPETWHLSAEALRESLDARGDRVAAVIACSTFGTAPPVWLSESWRKLCADAVVPLIVDSAPGFGSRDERGDLLGAQGDAEVFSFHATKPFAIGEGGALTTRDPKLAESVRRLANFGFGAERTVDAEAGLNAKMDEWHAAAALASLDSMDSVLEARRARAERIRAGLETHGLTFQPGSEHATWQFVPALVPTEGWRSAVLHSARDLAIEVRSYFDPPLHAMAAFSGLPRVGPLDATQSLSRRILSLPMSNDLSDEAIERILACVVEAGHVSAVDRAAGSAR